MKPDAVKRGIVGEILHRFERAGLKLIGSKMLVADRSISEKHYFKDETWQRKVGALNIEDCAKYGLDVREIFGTNDALEIGKVVNGWLFDLFDLGPVLAFVLEGPNAVEKVRALVGPTSPVAAPAGTIRGDYGLDSPFTSLKRKRAILNLIHSSGAVDEAEQEIALWFKKEELVDYARDHECVYSY